ncbi:quinol monooxygenase YgiN [Chitinophaga skermanii]|uniref:Quinol monooxygenase YgiN n=1 Tax=Chitinophaga skermanii TaxID=331697 RepID=A0A327QXK4_9BACT|nr:antibiotic biosynthesis monooxygenase family protein [Chitinophaga skermanii]RAJ08372.1 quinol monooxygenase YgiN [Chitinophaga skermanii]
MILRIVKMTFDPAKTGTFQELFAQQKSAIRNFPGCHHLELWRETANGNIFFTYSHWTSEDDLNNYRHSELFATTWAATKILFAGKPEAWSLQLADGPVPGAALQD